MILAGLLGHVVFRRSGIGRSSSVVDVSASDEGLRLGSRLVPRAAVTQGVVIPRDAIDGRLRETERFEDNATFGVRLERRWGEPIELIVGQRHEATALLRALGLDASRSVARFRGPTALAVSGRARTTTMNLALGLAAIGMTGAAFAAHMPMLLPFALVALGPMIASIPARIEVSGDGIATRWLTRRRFFSFDDVVSAEAYVAEGRNSHPAGVKLTLRSGEVVRLRTGDADDSAEHWVLAERIHEARALHARGGGASLGEQLRRSGRERGAWIAHLRSLGTGAAASHRKAAIDADALAEVLVDARASATDRAAAAIALAESEDAGAREKVLAAARATARPKLRVALEVAADREREAELEATMAELEAEEERRVKTEGPGEAS